MTAPKRLLKKYPNRRLYDTQTSAYVTLEDVRRFVLAREAIQVLDSRTGADITRSVLLQIIAEQETEGHEPLLTNRVLEVLIRFYGEPGYGLLGRFLENSVAAFLEQQRRYQRQMQQLLERSPLRVMQQFAEQNANFWRGLFTPGAPGATPDARVPAGTEPTDDASLGTPLDDDAPLDAGIVLHGRGAHPTADANSGPLEPRDDEAKKNVSGA